MATTLHIAKANVNFQLPEGHTGTHWAQGLQVARAPSRLWHGTS